MDHHSHDQQQQKDFLQSLFPSPDHTQSPIYPYTSSDSMSPNSSAQLNMNVLGNMMQMQGIELSSASASSSSGAGSSASYNPQMLMEQQFKLTQLQQLQQLQNQIFQQQVSRSFFLAWICVFLPLVPLVCHVLGIYPTPAVMESPSHRRHGLEVRWVSQSPSICALVPSPYSILKYQRLGNTRFSRFSKFFL